MSSSLLPYYRRLRDLEPELFELPPLLLLPYLDELLLLALLFSRLLLLLPYRLEERPCELLPELSLAELSDRLEYCLLSFTLTRALLLSSVLAL